MPIKLGFSNGIDISTTSSTSRGKLSETQSTNKSKQANTFASSGKSSSQSKSGTTTTGQNSSGTTSERINSSTITDLFTNITDKINSTVKTGQQTKEKSNTKAYTLSEEILNQLEVSVQDLLPSLGKNQQDSRTVLSLLLNNATNQREDLMAKNEKILDLAKLESKRSLKSLQTELARQAGGSIANTSVIGATAEAQVMLDAKLAELEAGLYQSATKSENDLLMQVLTGTQKDGSKVIDLLNILKGAESSVNVSTQGQLDSTVTEQASNTQSIDTYQDVGTIANNVTDILSSMTGTTATNEDITAIESALSQMSQTEVESVLTFIDKEYAQDSFSFTNSISAEAGFGIF